MSSEKSEIFSVSSANRLRHIYVEVNAEQRWIPDFFTSSPPKNKSHIGYPDVAPD